MNTFFHIVYVSVTILNLCFFYYISFLYDPPPKCTAPPVINSTVANGQLTVRKGGSVTLNCEATGNPDPTVLWSKKVTFPPYFIQIIQCSLNPRYAYQTCTKHEYMY